MDSRLPLTLFAFLILVGSLGCATAVDTKKEDDSAESSAIEEVREYKPENITRLTPAEVRPLVQQGEALLVCAYDSDEKFAGVRLEGAIPLSAFDKRLPHLATDKHLVFY